MYWELDLLWKADDLVSASLAGLKLGEVICVPALEDVSLLAQIQDSEGKFFESSRTDKVASRYGWLLVKSNPP